MDAETNVENQELKESGSLFQTPRFWIMVAIFLVALLVRLLLTNVMHGHPTDIVNFKAWTIHVSKHPFAEFYKSVNPTKGVWADYPPLYILVLWLVGKFYMIFDPSFAKWTGAMFTTLVKLPSILADLGCMALIYLNLRRHINASLAIFAVIVFAVHPAVIYESAMWGQVDSVTLFLQLLAIWFLFNKNESAAILVTTLNILVKPQGLILMPFVLFVTFYRKQWKQMLSGILGSAAVTFAVTAIFVPFQRIIPWLWEQYASQGNLYSYSSIQAFNLWSLSGMWKSDVARGIFGLGNGHPDWWLQHKTWGLILFGLVYAGALVYYWWRSKQNENEELLIWHVSALLMVAFFLFPTRMHERYLYSGLFLLLGSAVLQKRLLLPFLLYSGTFLLNLLYELPGHKTELKFAGVFYQINKFLDGQVASSGMWSFQWYKLIAILNLLLFAYFLAVLVSHPLKEISQQLMSFIQQLKNLHVQEAEEARERGYWIPVPKGLDSLDVKVLAGILFGSAIVKLWRLGFPPEMVFDEVYHARAAGEYILHIKPLEWVHPPLAKLLIAIGVTFYDLSGVGWRVLPVIAGTLLLFSVYCLGRFVLPYRWQAIAATIMLACDGVYFVQSRTAMTNIFATLFQVTALTLTWRFIQCYWHHPGQKRNYVYFLSAIIFIGLALSTRWTSLYSYGFIIGVLGFCVLVPSTLRMSSLVRGRVEWTVNSATIMKWILIPAITVLIPVIIYLIAYTPYYLNYGYDLAKVIKEQQGIWNYHSQLTDPHPYYSAWYTWPWLVRPTWYYFHNFGQTIGGIIALGNPAIWWFSMPVVVVVLVLAGMGKRLNFFYIAIACLFMYLPWGMSPRTLNYAHYFFEAVPYACLSAAALMGVLVQRLEKTGMMISAIYFSTVCGLFLFFYPIYSALPIPWSFYNLLRWFPSWV